MLQLLLLVATISCAYAALVVEHSFDGSSFSPAGELVGNFLSDTELSWTRRALKDDELELLEKAIETDGLYSIRLQTGKGTLLTSVPAACLRVTGFAEKAELHATRDGALVAFNYDISGCGAKLAAGGEGSGSAAAERPERVAVRVLLPTVGPMLSQPEVVGEFTDIPVESVDLGAAAFDPSAKPRAVAGAGAGAQGARKGGPPPPDERSWLQKNWLFVIAGGMMVLNVVAKANAPPQGPGGAPGGGPGAGAAGPRRG